MLKLILEEDGSVVGLSINQVSIDGRGREVLELYFFKNPCFDLLLHHFIGQEGISKSFFKVGQKLRRVIYVQTEHVVFGENRTDKYACFA